MTQPSADPTAFSTPQSARPAESAGGAAVVRGQLTAWVLTDGKAGDVNPALALAEALGARTELRKVAPRAPWVWFLPRGPIDPAERSDRAGSPIAPPFPDLVIACGRRAIAYGRVVKRLAGPGTFLVVLRNPRTRRHGADMLWMPAHDSPRGPNVFVTRTTPHLLTPERLATARAAPPAWLLELPRPRVAVILGGGPGLEDLPGRLAACTEAGSFMVTPSRRTDPALTAEVARVVARHPHHLWDGTGENPYFAMAANADAIVVSGDSFNMVCEVLATGRPVLVHEPAKLSRKLVGFLTGLRRDGLIRRFEGRLEAYTYEPIDATAAVAGEVARRMAGKPPRAGAVSEGRHEAVDPSASPAAGGPG